MPYLLLIKSELTGVKDMKLMHFFLQTIKIFIIFTICMSLFYFGLLWINEEYENYNRYNQPEGNAIKVSSTTEFEEPSQSIIERFILFLKISE